MLNRRFAVPPYRASVSNGWLTITTSPATLRYQLGSGPFGPSNVAVSFRDAGQATTVSPAWQNECPYDQVCDAGAAALSGPANIETDHAGYQSVAGFIAGLGQGNSAGANWTVLGAPAGPAQVTLRYSNYIGALGGPAPRTIDLVVNGTDVGPVTLPGHVELGRLVHGDHQRLAHGGRPTRSACSAPAATAATSTSTRCRCRRPGPRRRPSRS